MTWAEAFKAVKNGKTVHRKGGRGFYFAKDKKLYMRMGPFPNMREFEAQLPSEEDQAEDDWEEIE